MSIPTPLNPGEVIETTVNNSGETIHVIINTRTNRITGGYFNNILRGHTRIHMADMDNYVPAVTMQEMLAKYDPFM